MTSTIYKPPKTLWEVSDQLKLDEPLAAEDPRFVETEQARGDFSFDALYKRLGVDPRNDELKVERDRFYILFCGHRGCGKSTELRRLTEKMNTADKFCVIFLDAVRQLDPNNLEYADVLLALAQNLFARLDRESIDIDPVFLRRLENWFKERVEQHESTREYAAGIQAGIKAKSGVPFFGALFAAITNSFKVSSSYKNELRQVIKNSFSEFADAFNQLLVEVENKLRSKSVGRKLLFVIDGTDRLTGDDSRRFFITDVHQLQLINGLFVYCAPIHLIYEVGDVNQTFDFVFKLPMIKLCDKGSEVRIDSGYKAMRELIYRRAEKALFDSEDTVVDYLIEYSGGHPRDLLRLLNYAFDFADEDRFDNASAVKAVEQLASDYRRLLDTPDYPLLYEIDRADAGRADNSTRARHLLFNLALLEYNAYWWQSHPVVRTLPGYLDAAGDQSE